MVTKLPGSRCRKGACSAKAHRTHFLTVKFCMRINPKSLGSFSAGLLVKVSCFPVQMSNLDFWIEERQYLCCGFLFRYSWFSAGQLAIWGIGLESALTWLMQARKIKALPPGVIWETSPFNNALLGPSTTNDHVLGREQSPLKRLPLFVFLWVLSPFLSLAHSFSLLCPPSFLFLFLSFQMNYVDIFFKKNKIYLSSLCPPFLASV